MKNVHFYKYQGAGNDFIIIDGSINPPELSPKEITFLCDRRFGIGADGLMIFEKADGFDFSMRYFNSDGSEDYMCGNGGRCMVAFAARETTKNAYVFSAVDGIHHAKLMNRNGNEMEVCIEINYEDNIRLYEKDMFFLYTGTPHLVIFDTDVAKMDVAVRGAFWRHHPDFAPKGTNVNFVEIASDGNLFVRTFERGVEAETLACGTGVTASAIATYVRTMVGGMHSLEERHIYPIRTLGGKLQVSFKTKGNNFYEVELTGPATFVFEGDISLPV